jgi:carbonic anhydrase
METFTDDVMRKLLRSSLKTCRVDASGWHDAGGDSAEGEHISWLTIANLEQGVVEDVRASATIPWCPVTSPSTATSTMRRAAT